MKHGFCKTILIMRFSHFFTKNIYFVSADFQPQNYYFFIESVPKLSSEI